MSAMSDDGLRPYPTYVLVTFILYLLSFIFYLLSFIFYLLSFHFEFIRG